MEVEMLVREALAAFAQGDMDGFFALLSPDIFWRVHAAPPLPLGGQFHGRESCEAMLRSLAQLLQIRGILWSAITAGAADCALYGIASHRGSNGMSETSLFAHWYSVKDGRITGIEQFVDTISIFNMLQGRPSSLPAINNASGTAESIGVLAASAMQTGSGTPSPECGAVLAFYGPEAPPRNITLPEHAHEHIEWRSSGMDLLPTGGVFLGRESFGRHMSACRELYEPYSMDIEGSIACGDSLALHGHVELKVRHNGRSVRSPWFQALTLRDGRIARGLEVVDTLSIARALSPESFPPSGGGE